MMHKIKVSRALSPITTIDNTVLTTQVMDMQGADSCEFVINTGTIPDVDATFAVVLQEGDQANGSDAANVAEQDMISGVRGTPSNTAASFTFASDDAVMRIGYIGNHRYVRLVITPTNNSGNLPVSVLCIQGNLRFQPS
jgi:hypothetical protein